MKLLTTLLMAFSLFACSNPAPDADICVTNIKKGHKKCYNLARDYYEDGTLKPTASPTYKPALTLSDFDKEISTDLKGFQNIKILTTQIEYRLNECENQQ